MPSDTTSSLLERIPSVVRSKYFRSISIIISLVFPVLVAYACIPTSLTATPGACGTGSITISWSNEAANGAIGYNLHDNNTPIYTAPNGTTVSYTQTGLTPGSTHAYIIQGIGKNSDGSTYTTEWFGPAYATAPGVCSVPTVPANLKATPGACGTATTNVTWNASSGATSYTLMDSATSSGATVYENGAPASVSSNVALLYYYNNTVYQEDAKCQWYEWTGVKWLSTSNPNPAGTPACSPSGSGSSSVSDNSSTTTPLVLYDNKLENGYTNSSWGGTYNFSNTSPVYSGADSISATYSSAYGGLYMISGDKSLAGLDTLHFFINGGTKTGQNVVAQLTTASPGGAGPAIQIMKFCAAGVIPANAWTECKVPLSLLQLPTTYNTMFALTLQDMDGLTWPAMYFDQVSVDDLIPASTPEAPGAAVSASGTMIPAANQIVDSSHNVWTLGVYAGLGTSYSATGQVPGSSHSYTIVATNSAGTSAYSAAVATSTPTGCGPDLTAGNTVASPSSGVTGSSESFSASASNIGNTTATNFPNIFQIADSAMVNTIARVTAGTVSSLSAGGTPAPLSGSYNFGTPGSYNVRACANMNTSGATGISELDTTNDCGSWLPLIIASPSPSCSTLTATPTTVDTGGSVALNWSCSNAASCTAISNSDGFTTGGSVSGSDSATPTVSNGQVTYGMTCGGTNFYFPTVNVVTPAVTISATPDRIAPGGNTVISWTSTNVNSCAVTKNGAAWTSGLNNSSTTVAITGQTTFVITCTTSGSPVSASTLVDVTPGFTEF